MAKLDSLTYRRISTGLQRSPQLFGSAPNVLKADLLEAIENTDTWIENNTSSYNNALPLKFKNNATLGQKTVLFCIVALARTGNIALLKALLGEVD